MACVTTTSFSISINGNIHGYFKGKRGLRQGDPLSPYLFTLVMEVLSLILQQKVANNPLYRFHNRCAKDRVINVCFADDLFLFARGDIASVSTIMEVINEFQEMSGLVLSVPKSTTFLCNVSDSLKHAILSIMPFEQGQLPVQYLGVPLISTRLVYQDCKILLERMEKLFILPARIIKELEQQIRRFLWSHDSAGKIKPKASWKSICLPKAEGGLGIRRIQDVNYSLMTTHIWSILTKRDSLWVKWIYLNKLKGRSFWDVPLQAGASWGWRKLYNLEPKSGRIFGRILGMDRRQAPDSIDGAQLVHSQPLYPRVILQELVFLWMLE
uniref:uncharacterized protein LOC122591592 n=1 Tax=Erigeron canadensis TaxID=72917 RepID=UPI001CB8A4D3|nr:uncharacterized protein LOC122591592 [Erigeron canadensis]